MSGVPIRGLRPGGIARSLRRLAPAAGDGGGDRWLWLALAVGLAVQFVPYLAFPAVLTQDGPAHVDGAWVLLHHGDAGPVGEALRQQYRIDLSPVPNMFSTVVLAGLLRLLSPDVAERVLLIALVLALTAALGYAARGVDRRAGWLAVAALPFAGSYLVAYGFYNFAWGMVGFLLVTGLALRRPAGWSARSTAGLALLLTFTWTAHLMPFAAAVGLAGVLGLARAVADRRAGRPGREIASRRLLPVVLAAVPGAVLTAVYLRSGQRAPATPDGLPDVERLPSLLSGLKPFVVARPAELLAAATIMTVLLLVLLIPRPPGAEPVVQAGPERWALGLLLPVTILAFALTPKRLGAAYGFLDDRLAWFPALLLVLAVAARPAGRTLRAVATVLLVLAASTAVLVRLPSQAPAVQADEEVMGMAGHLRPACTLVVLTYARVATVPGFVTSPLPDPVRHLSSRLAMKARCVDLGHYEAVEPYFQVTFAGAEDLHRRLSPQPDGLERLPPRVDLAAVRGKVDYVLVVGLDRASPTIRRSPWTQAVVTELTQRFRPVATSPSGLVQLWSGEPQTSGPTVNTR